MSLSIRQSIEDAIAYCIVNADAGDYPHLSALGGYNGNVYRRPISSPPTSDNCLVLLPGEEIIKDADQSSGVWHKSLSYSIIVYFQENHYYEDYFYSYPGSPSDRVEWLQELEKLFGTNNTLLDDENNPTCTFVALTRNNWFPVQDASEGSPPTQLTEIVFEMNIHYQQSITDPTAGW